MIRIIKETTFKDNPHGIKDAEIENEQARDVVVHVYNSKIRNCQFERCVVDLFNVDVKDCTFRNCWFKNLNKVKFFESTLYSCTIHLLGTGFPANTFLDVDIYSTDLNNILFTSNPFNPNRIVDNIKNIDT